MLMAKLHNRNSHILLFNLPRNLVLFTRRPHTVLHWSKNINQLHLAGELNSFWPFFITKTSNLELEM